MSSRWSHSRGLSSSSVTRECLHIIKAAVMTPERPSIKDLVSKELKVAALGGGVTVGTVGLPSSPTSPSPFPPPVEGEIPGFSLE